MYQAAIEAKTVTVSVNQPSKVDEIERRITQAMVAPRKAPTLYKGIPID
jgi:hypothetical protein